MSRKIDTILAECLAALESGATVEQCLQRFPHEAEELRPLLEMWAALQQVPPAPTPHPAVIAHGKARMFDAVERRFASPQRRSLFGTIRLPRWTAAAAMIVVVAMGMAGTTAMAASAIPGDLLYPVKTATESVRLFLTLSPEARAELEAELQQERLEEVALVLAEGRTVEVNFWGTLNAWDAESWSVAGYTVRITSATEIEGTPVIGARVEVWAETEADGSLVAQRLVVTPSAEIAPHSVVPTPTVKPARTPSVTPRQQHGRPTATKTPISEPITRTLTPTPYPTEEPTPLPTPTREHHGERTPTPTKEHNHDRTPVPPPLTPTPMPTPMPTGTPCIEHTPTPTMPPLPSMTPTPMPTHDHQHEVP